MALRYDEPETEKTDHERLEALDAQVGRTNSWTMGAVLLAVIALGGGLVTAAVLLIVGHGAGDTTVVQGPAEGTGQVAGADGAAPDAEHGGGSASAAKAEPYARPDPTLPKPPPGVVKKFKVDVFEHVTKVSDDKPPTRVWSFGVNGKLHRGTGVSTPMVVTEGDKVAITLVNGASKAMDVKMPHSIDYHSSEVAPNKAFKTIEPGETHRFSFTADHPGVFMYHCATDPVLMHTAAGMVGMMIVKPKNLAPVDRELWMTQQEFYLGKPGQNSDPVKQAAKEPDVLTFNGYANQYKKHPVAVKRGEKIRMFVMNAGPSIWSAFHIIGTVFDRTMIEGTPGKDAQTVNLAPSQGGWVEFTLAEEGNYPFVTHAFGDMVKGGVGVLSTANAPAGGMKH